MPAGADPAPILIWNIAFAPMYGVFLEYMLTKITGANPGDFWWTTLVLNLILIMIDAHLLNKAGYGDVSRFAFLVPVYLFRRAVTLRQSPHYAWAWLAVFALCVVAPALDINGPDPNTTAAVEAGIKSACSDDPLPCTDVQVTKVEDYKFTGIITLSNGIRYPIVIKVNEDGSMVWQAAKKPNS